MICMLHMYDEQLSVAIGYAHINTINIIIIFEKNPDTAPMSFKYFCFQLISILLFYNVIVLF